MAPIRVLIADDSAVACRMIALMLGTDPELQVVGTAPTGRLAIEKAEQLTPDVLLLDLAMPDMRCCALATCGSHRETSTWRW